MSHLPSIFEYLPEHAPAIIKLAMEYPSTGYQPMEYLPMEFKPVEYKPFFGKEDFSQVDDDQLPKHPIRHGLVSIGLPLLGFGGGMALGHLATQAVRRLVPDPNSNLTRAIILKASPLLATAAGTAYGIYKQKELEELRRALESYKRQSARRAASK